MFSPTRLAAALDAWITRTPAEAPCHCARCADRAAALVPATAEQAAQSGFPQIGEGDLLCPACAEVLSADAADAAMADAPAADRGDACGTLCDECGRHMADPRGPTCTGCLAAWFTPGVSVARDVSEGPRPSLFDNLVLVSRAALGTHPPHERARVLAVLARRGYDIATDLRAQGLAVQARPYRPGTLADITCASAAIALSAGLDRRALQTLTEGGVRA